MKNLPYIFSLVFLLACNRESKLNITKQDIGQDLDIIQQVLKKNIYTEIKTKIATLKKQARQKRERKEALENIKRFLAIKTKYQNILKKLDNNDSSKEAYIEIFKEHRHWLGSLENLGAIAKNFQKTNTEEIIKTLKHTNAPKTQQKLKLQISDDFLRTVIKLGADDLPIAIKDFRKFLLLSTYYNQTLKIEEGSFIKLQQILVYSGTLEEKYDSDVEINKGKIQERHGSYNISIPTQKLGTHNFEVICKLKDWETDKDTTLYFTKTFEVIE